jgi:anthranilate synthase/aminodeoxychorismate synthase-like glutamine amidotransferase
MTISCENWQKGGTGFYNLRVLIVDHRDSFTYNIYHLFKALGQDVLVKDYAEVSPEDCLANGPVILGPGPHSPLDVPESVRLFLEIAGRVPVLGICLGHEIIGVAMGGRTRRASRVVHGVISRVKHDGNGLFRGIGNPARFVRYHSLVLDLPLPAGLRATAFDEDGDLAALEQERLGVWGVQFHPESALSEQGEILARNFLELAKAI